MGQPAITYESELEKASNKALVSELRKMYKEDQWLRWKIHNEAKQGKSLDAIVEKMRAADRKHTARLTEIVEAHGWPTLEQVGIVGAEMAFTLVQHADQNPAFQRQCLELMEPLVATGDVRKLHFAFLTDRVLINEGKEQRYGSQFTQDENGEWCPRPLADPENVERLRAEMEMDTLADYKKSMERICGKGK
jgi:hypothetical protein